MNEQVDEPEDQPDPPTLRAFRKELLLLLMLLTKRPYPYIAAIAFLVVAWFLPGGLQRLYDHQYLRALLTAGVLTGLTAFVLIGGAHHHAWRTEKGKTFFSEPKRAAALIAICGGFLVLLLSVYNVPLERFQPSQRIPAKVCCRDKHFLSTGFYEVVVAGKKPTKINWLDTSNTATTWVFAESYCHRPQGGVDHHCLNFAEGLIDQLRLRLGAHTTIIRTRSNHAELAGELYNNQELQTFFVFGALIWILMSPLLLAAAGALTYLGRRLAAHPLFN